MFDLLFFMWKKKCEVTQYVAGQGPVDFKVKIKRLILNDGAEFFQCLFFDA